jgi:uncharacterized protein with NRDE domain
MCTLAIYFQATDSYPVVIAANRDEFLERPASPPTTLSERPWIVGGKDLRAGGTWLGINQYGMVAGLLNRRSETPANPRLRSRGLLCLDALKCASAEAAARLVEGLSGGDYNPFNLLVASREHAYVAYNRDERIDVMELAAGLHLLTNLNLDDFECPKISGAFGKFAALGADPQFRRDPISRRADLARVLADHRTQLDPRSGRPNSLCVHLGVFGTRCSSLIFVGADSSAISHYFAPGPPCSTAYEAAAVPVGPHPTEAGK